MLSKLLLTLAVIMVALIILQRRRVAARMAELADGKAVDAASARPASEFRAGVWLFLILMLGAASVIGVQRWQDANREVTVLLHREGSSSPVVYRVNRKELSDRSFTTTDGVRVTVSANERMEVIGL